MSASAFRFALSVRLALAVWLVLGLLSGGRSGRLFADSWWRNDLTAADVERLPAVASGSWAGTGPASSLPVIPIDLADASSRCPSAWTWQLMPKGLIYRAYLAGAKESRFRSTWSDDRGAGTRWAVPVSVIAGKLRHRSAAGCVAPVVCLG